jgi:rare lipoprotein A
MNERWRVLLGAFLLLVGACAAPQLRPRAWEDPSGEIGLASWYGVPYHGRRTSSGEVYDMYQLTAAHRDIPLGSWVEVTSLSNARSLTVRINDRGPFVEGRIIDLSYAAASLLGIIGPGVDRVRVRLSHSPQGGVGPARFSIQAGSFTAESSAQALRAELQRHISGARIVKAVVGGEMFYRVRVGSFSSRSEAQPTAERLAALGYRVLIMESADRL